MGCMQTKRINKTFETRIPLDDRTSEVLAKNLNRALAATMDLKAQVKHAHWNIKGAHFYARHLLFDDLAAHLEVATDDIAERATTLGYFARGTIRQAAEASPLPEYDLDAISGEQHLTALADRYGRYVALLRDLVREASSDAVTEDLFIEKLRESEKDLWFIESQLHSR